uniref:RNA-dependent RNA polymerase n=1 Tax=Anisakis simplex TaxID=6269 RepID=A0A0M3J615_ANISI
LGSSNSQMRDHGCYFFDAGENGGQVDTIRAQLGVFDRSNIPKLMARIGQCFTQAKKKLKESQVKLLDKHHNQTFDVIGGRNTSGEPYIFSDGCGRISKECAKDIAKDLGLENCVPSCFQVR